MEKTKVRRKPKWLRVNYERQSIKEIEVMMEQLSLNTVCKEAKCPNLGECYKKRTATFMIMGSQCTRNCRFCNVTNGKPQNLDINEPENVAKAVKELGLSHAVITSVTRDDLEDCGASHFAKTIEAVKSLNPDTTVEVLIPDLKGIKENLDIVIKANPDVINHNVETVERLYDTVRPEAIYERSIDVLKYVKEVAPHILTKTGIMVGLSESDEEVFKVMDDVLKVGCDIFTIGQYLRPSNKHIEVYEYVTPEKFEEYRVVGVEKGFKYIASSPLVRSSYNAQEAIK
ncbi:MULTISPECIES: lipoyl synthase [Romboutsia]|uniref:Lipoyl synthase n=1 Tax=Romboutsia hominis TaxID=1507512 RepID=A0A2P2BQ01_9FIRM|nr:MULTISPECIES: lipoyl synthase [Romboutsia]MCH1959748.1 lipoyl synthase [Romboutsia hominis]MCH1969829.1 lipoyl synthase [Romboutsia hominis]MDB8790749.1 lipoyl synthase [Romboutsia sp. 1001216sp1]MDB8792502.1 lipoyl synthase [Romboutsia sp. 1001216sp1]MDB8795797.1 lipoyl synthase [Romboutsia sp. 1001216sp1]